jgi:hypothetical protein
MERRRAALLACPTHRRRVPGFGSQSPTIREGLLLLKGCLCAPCAMEPAQASSTSIWTPLLGQHTAPGEGEYSFTECGQLHATPSVHERFSSSHLSPNTLACDLLCGEGAATEPHTTNGRHHERSKPVEDPKKSEGVLALDDSHILFSSLGDLNRLGLAFTIADADAREVEPSGIEAHERGGVLPVAGAAPAMAKGTAGIKPIGEAESHRNQA